MNSLKIQFLHLKFPLILKISKRKTIKEKFLVQLSVTEEYTLPLAEVVTGNRNPFPLKT